MSSLERDGCRGAPADVDGCRGPAAGAGSEESGRGVPAAGEQGTPPVPATRMALSAGALHRGTRPDLVCTLDGPDAMRDRVAEWQAVIGDAVRREPADGGVTLVFDHDPAGAAQLARLASAEFACCSFFTFALTVGPPAPSPSSPRSNGRSSIWPRSGTP